MQFLCLCVGTAQNCGETVNITGNNLQFVVNNTRPNLCLRCMSDGTDSFNVQWTVGSTVLTPGGSGLDSTVLTPGGTGFPGGSGLGGTVLTPGGSGLGGNLMNVGGVLVIVDPSTLIMDGAEPYEISSCLSPSQRFVWEDSELFSSSE